MKGQLKAYGKLLNSLNEELLLTVTASAVFSVRSSTSFSVTTMQQIW